MSSWNVERNFFPTLSNVFFVCFTFQVRKHSLKLDFIFAWISWWFWLCWGENQPSTFIVQDRNSILFFLLLKSNDWHRRIWQREMFVYLYFPYLGNGESFRISLLSTCKIQLIQNCWKWSLQYSFSANDLCLYLYLVYGRPD